MKANFKSTLLMAVLATAGFGAQADGLGFYALLDASIATTTVDGGTSSSATKFVTGGYAPNFAGITGEKSLGKDFVGGFKLEQGFLLNSDAETGAFGNQFAFGNQSLFNRQANLFLQSKYGKAVVGTQPNIAFATVLVNDPRFGSNYGSSLASLIKDGGLGTVDVGALSYTAPTYYGLTVAVSHVPESLVGTTRQTGNRLSAVYSYKDLTATLGHYYDISGGATLDKGNIVGGNYKMGPLTLKAMGAAQTTTTYSSLNTIGLGGTYALSSETTLDFGVYNSKDSGMNYKSDTIGVGITYKFLKDLSVYAQYANVKNNGSTTVASNFTWAAATTLNPGQTANSYNVGLLYSFF